MKLFAALTLLLLLCACHKHEPQAAQPDTEHSNTIADTVYKTFDARRYEGAVYNDSLHRADTTLSIDNKSYALTFTAKNLLDKSYTFVNITDEKPSVHKDTYTGYDAAYVFTLTDAIGKTVFSTQLTKKDFEDETDGTVLAETYMSAPVFEGYVPSFDSFIFTVSFMIPDSDVGDEVFILIDRKGNVKHILYNNSYGGGGCDGGIDISPRGDFIAANYYLIYPDGSKRDMADKKAFIVGKRLLNANTLLVVLDRGSNEGPNAQLITPRGKVLKTFDYNGYDELLGYILTVTLDDYALYLLDETTEELFVIPFNNPLKMSILPLKSLKQYTTRTASETEFILQKETSKRRFTFARDTVTGSFRYR